MCLGSTPTIPEPIVMPPLEEKKIDLKPEEESVRKKKKTGNERLQIELPSGSGGSGGSGLMIPGGE